MVMQSSTLKKLLFGIVLCVVPMGLCAMTSGKRVGSGKKTAKVTPIDVQEVIAKPAEALDRPDSPHALMSSNRTKKIEEWVEKGPCVKPSVSFDTNTVGFDRAMRYSSVSEPVSGIATPLHFYQSISDESFPSSSSQSKQLSEFEERIWTLERISEDRSLEMTDSVVSYHAKLNELLNLSEDGAACRSKGRFAQVVDAKIATVSKALINLDNQQQCAKEKVVALQQQFYDSSAALKIQKESTDVLVNNLKVKDKRVEDLKQTVNTLVAQVVLLQKMVQQQSRPWWKRCFGSCSKRSDVDEDGSVKTLIFPMRVCDDSVQTDSIAQ